MSKQIETAKLLIKQITETVRKEANNLYYEGEDYKFMYDELIKELDEVNSVINECIDKAIRLKNHKCIFNDEDYCDICGKDGKA